MGQQEAAPPERVVTVVTGGEGALPRAAASLARGAIVVAADSGVDLALAAGLRVDHAVGDFDSVTPDGLAAVEAAGGRMHRHEADKDATDLELALAVALDLMPTRIVVLGPGGGRIDHELADLLLLASAPLGETEVVAHLGVATVTVVRRSHPAAHLTGAVGAQVSLLPVHGPAWGVTTFGLRWPLANAMLVPGTTRGVSNELVDTTATVTCEHGVLLVLQPGRLADPVPPRASPYDPSPGAPPPAPVPTTRQDRLAEPPPASQPDPERSPS
ncbi:MAG: thiamine pyrophosphokinae [Acidimicrobiales bacterium]|nr:thiamine pyrophosphokinae [Acidimicrobiales bacterium]